MKSRNGNIAWMVTTILLIAIPSAYAMPAPPIQISAGASSTCATLSNGAIECWGLNNHGQLGDGTTTNSATPVIVQGITTAQSVAVGHDSACAVMTDGSVQCWGGDEDGQLGDGTTTDSHTPKVVPNVKASAISMLGDGTQVCVTAVKSDSVAAGAIQCWGAAETYNFGSPTSMPMVIPGTNGGASVAMGVNWGCTLTTASTIWCWGHNATYGVLGYWTPKDNLGNQGPVPVQVSLSTNQVPTAVAGGGGDFHVCALLQSGNVECWGENNFGQLGDDTITDSHTPVVVENINNASTVTTGSYFTCVVTEGMVQCFGHNPKGLGDGTYADSHTPVTVNGITTAIAVSAGNNHACVLLKDGTIQCWGLNTFGQLGNGTTTDSSTPVVVQPVSVAKTSGGDAPAPCPAGSEHLLVSLSELAEAFECVQVTNPDDKLSCPAGQALLSASACTSTSNTATPSPLCPSGQSPQHVYKCVALNPDGDSVCPPGEISAGGACVGAVAISTYPDANDNCPAGRAIYNLNSVVILCGISTTVSPTYNYCAAGYSELFSNKGNGVCSQTTDPDASYNCAAGQTLFASAICTTKPTTVTPNTCPSGYYPQGVVKCAALTPDKDSKCPSGQISVGGGCMDSTSIITHADANGNCPKDQVLYSSNGVKLCGSSTALGLNAIKPTGKETPPAADQPSSGGGGCSLIR